MILKVDLLLNYINNVKIYTTFDQHLLIQSDVQDDICEEEDIAVDWLMQNNVNIEEQKKQNMTGLKSYSYPKLPFLIIHFSFTLKPFPFNPRLFNQQTKSKKMHTLTVVMCSKIMG